MGSFFPKVLFVVVALTGMLSCSRPPEIVGIDNPVHPVASVQEATLRRVFIATTRESSEVAGAFFSDRRAPELGFASVVVSIPPNHVQGNLERPSHLPPNPETEFAIIQPTVYETDGAFIAQINRELAKLPPKDRDILFFVHGYNNTVSDSILRMAQFSEDTGFKGVSVLFSWASAARATRYVYDLNSTLVARPRLLETARVLRHTNAKGVSVFAHSMGAFLTLEAIIQAQIAGKYNTAGLIDNVMFAAPDIDLDLFRTQMQLLPKSARDFFIFVSRDDFALRFSRSISGGVQRVGAADAEELAGLGVTVIDLSQIEDSTSGTHSKFAGSPEVVQLIGKSLRQDNYETSANLPTLKEYLDGIPVLNIFTD